MGRRLLGGLLASLFLWMAVMAYGQDKLEGLPEALLKEVKAPGNLPMGRYAPVKVWEAEAKELGHKYGHTVPDPQAEGGVAWEVRVAAEPGAGGGEEKEQAAAGSGYVLYGPYVELPPGNYVAFFRMKLLDIGDEESVADLDACVGYGQNVLGVREVLGSDLVGDQYTQAPLGFHYTGGKLECRVNWTGNASFRIDRISLFRLEGANVGTLSGKVPEPKESGLPKALAYYSGARPFPEVFPRANPPAAKLLVVDLRQLRPDWQLCLLSLQGIVNRERPQIYCLFNALDADWLEWMQKRGFIKEMETVSRADDLIHRFQDKLKGMVITDPKLPATRNIATMIAGVEDAVVVSPRIAKQLSLPVREDLRGRWQTSVEAYRWAFENLWGRLNHHVIACLWPDHHGLRDYLVQNKVFIFWLCGPIDGARKYSRPDDEVKLMEELLAKMPVNIPVMGYPWAGKDVGIGEGPGVKLFAEFGKYLVGSVNCSNLSVHSGIPDVKFEQHIPPAPPLQKDKVYVGVILSDGDNLPVLTLHNFPQLWKDPLRGQFPIGWTISPSARLLIPDIANYYYSTATPNDCFLGAVSGVGYTYPDHYGERFKEPDRARVFDEFLDQTRETMEKMDLKDIWIMGVTRPELIRRYAERIPFLEAVFPDYGRRVTSYDEATYPTVRNVGVFHAANGWTEGAPREEQIAKIVSQIRSLTPTERPAFIHFFIWNWGFDLSMIQEVLQRLGPEYVAVRPDHMAMLYRQEIAGRKVLIRTPGVLSGVEDMPIVFTACVNNTSDGPQEMTVRIVAGMDRAVVTPAQGKVGTGEALNVTISGVPTADQVVLAYAGGFGERQSAITCRRIIRQEIVGPLPSDAMLQFVRHIEAEQLAHRSGKEEKDERASAQAVWAARAGETEAGHIVFGPYTPTKAGRYLAVFRMKRIGEGLGVAATLDTSVAAPVRETASREVRAEELPLGEYRSFAFQFDHPGGPLETRVFWPGKVSVAVDSVTIWEVTKQE